MSVRNTIFAVMLLAALSGLTGCGDETPDIPPEVVSKFPFPDTPDKVMANFQAVYETMDFAEFINLMDPAFVTILQQSTVNEFPAVGPKLDVQAEARIHERMFSTQDVIDPLGSLVPGIQAIGFQTFERQGSWDQSLPNDAIPNTTSALYDVVILYDRGQSRTMLKSQGAIKFYVTHRDSVVGGVPKPFYQLVGQLDLTVSKKGAEPGAMGTEYIAWGSLKARFR